MGINKGAGKCSINVMARQRKLFHWRIFQHLHLRWAALTQDTKERRSVKPLLTGFWNPLPCLFSWEKKVSVRAVSRCRDKVMMEGKLQFLDTSSSIPSAVITEETWGKCRPALEILFPGIVAYSKENQLHPCKKKNQLYWNFQLWIMNIFHCWTY